MHEPDAWLVEWFDRDRWRFHNVYVTRPDIELFAETDQTPYRAIPLYRAVPTPVKPENSIGET